jgi:Putative transposase/Transposase zinc-binding domain
VGTASALEVAHVFRAFGPRYRERHHGQLPARHLRAMWAIEHCRTPALGGHLYACDRCGRVEVRYHSCRNRHCPKCQGLASERWLAARAAELLPVPYAHVVFTLPGELRPLALRNQRPLYDLLFRAASHTLLEIAADPRHLGARIGLWSVLHTWGQTLIDHPHLHCVVPAGGISLDGSRWIACRNGFFLPVRVLSRLFRGKVLAGLRAAYEAGELAFPGAIAPLAQPDAFAALLDKLSSRDWVVYSKPPFGGPEHVLRYLARYTHRIAISNHRLVRLDGDRVVLTYRDSAGGNRRRELALPAEEFIRRFLLHVLPDGFVRIRSYGLLANRHRHRNLERCRELLGGPLRPGAPTATEESPDASTTTGARTDRPLVADPLRCNYCGKGHLHPIAELAPGPPAIPATEARAPP